MMVNAYVDPNYEPESTYWQIESLLLICNKIHVYAPNAYALSKAAKAHAPVPINPDRFLLLVERKLIIPVAAPRYWNESWRSGEATKQKRISQERSNFYRWTDFDVAVRALPQSQEIDFYRFGEAACNLPDTDPNTYKHILSKVSSFRKHGRLPEQFNHEPYRNWSDDKVCRKLLFDLGNDVGVAHLTNSGAFILSPGQTGLHSLYNQLCSDLPPVPINVLQKHISSSQFELEKEDFLVAREFADRIAAKYDLLDIIEEYRRSKFNALFQLFVDTRIKQLRSEGKTGQLLVSGLLSIFNKTEAEIKDFGEVCGRVAGTMAGAAVVEFIRRAESKEIFKKVLSRRRFLLTILGLGTVSGLGPCFVGSVFGDARGRFSKDTAWISLVAKAPKRDL